MRYFLQFDHLSDSQIEALLRQTHDISRNLADSDYRELFAGRIVANLFYESSTRTRVSFEVAARRLGMDVVNISARESSIEKGETLRDTLETLAAIGAEVAVVRHPQSGALQEFSEDPVAGLQLINAGDGSGGHPSQALLDAAVLQAAFSELSEIRMVIAGDIKHSRVVASALSLLPRLGAKDIRLVGPEQLLPSIQPASVSLMTTDFDAALKGANVIMMLRVQRERLSALDVPAEAEYSRKWGLDSRRLALAEPDSVVLHPGPLNRGVEISNAVADGAQSLIRQQVAMGVPARMAIFSALLEDNN